ncbi:MAG: hypothetical protein ACRD1B_04315, partial [Thermoanaerobaculia bacterium]
MHGADLPLRFYAKSHKRWHSVSRKISELRRNRANLNRTSALSFGQIARLTVELSIATLTREERRALVEVRNRVAHATRELVESFDDVLRVAHAKRTCLGLSL